LVASLHNGQREWPPCQRDRGLSWTTFYDAPGPATTRCRIKGFAGSDSHHPNGDRRGVHETGASQTGVEHSRRWWRCYRPSKPRLTV